jgi:soluble lytic murein transglycosylase-like protein
MTCSDSCAHASGADEAARRILRPRPRRRASRLVLAFASLLVPLLASAATGRGADAQRDPELKAVVQHAIETADCFTDRYESAVWYKMMEPRLRKRVPDHAERLEILRTVYCEAQRPGEARLPPGLVMAVIDVESRFNRYAVSSAGAVGLMQVMPFWPEQLGMRRYELTRVGSNIRMGCAILRHYLGVERNNLNRALARYNGSLGRRDYSDLVIYRWSTWNGADDLGLASANQPVRKASGG